MASDILIVDDEADIGSSSPAFSRMKAIRHRLAKDSDEALRAIEERRPSLVILDIWLQGSKLDGLDVLARAKKMHPDFRSSSSAATAISKPRSWRSSAAPTTISKSPSRPTGSWSSTRAPWKPRSSPRKQGAKGEKLLRLRPDRQIGDHEPPAAEHPEGGADQQPRDDHGAARSGKELAARYLHATSPRADGPFVAVNAASMAPDRVEIEFFGVEETGQTARKVGALEEAHNGTLYIDEVADMPMDTQGKLLRVLVEQKFQRVGGGPKVAVDVRIVSSTSRDLEREMSAGRFRQDLFHRLNVVPLTCPRSSSGARTSPNLSSISSSRSRRPQVFRRASSATTPWRSAIARMAGKCPPAPQYRRARHDYVHRRPGYRHHRRYAARRHRSQRPFIVERLGGEHLMSLPFRDAREISNGNI